MKPRTIIQANIKKKTTAQTCSSRTIIQILDSSNASIIAWTTSNRLWIISLLLRTKWKDEPLQFFILFC